MIHHWRENLFVCSNVQPQNNYRRLAPDTDLISCIPLAWGDCRDTFRKPNLALSGHAAWRNPASAHICKLFFTSAQWCCAAHLLVVVQSLAMHCIGDVLPWTKHLSSEWVPVQTSRRRSDVEGSARVVEADKTRDGTLKSELVVGAVAPPSNTYKYCVRSHKHKCNK